MDSYLPISTEKVSSNTNIMTSVASSSQKSPSTVDIPIIKESQGLKNHGPDVDEASKKATTALESFSPSNKGSNQNDPHDKTAHTKDESFNVSVEKEIIESEGSTIERTTTREEQVITQRQVKTTEESFQLTPEELFERFPELRGTLLNNTSQNSKSDFVVGGKGTFHDPKTMTASQEQSTITSTTCPDDKDATLITINKSVLTKHTAQGFSSSKPDDTKEEELESSKMETCPTKNEQDSPSDDKTPTSSSSETVQATQEPSANQSRPDKKKNKLLGGKNSCCTIS